MGCPAVIVHPRWAGASAFEGSGSHWVAIRIAGVVVLSVYLPRAGREHLFEEVLGEVASFLEARPADRFIIGTDANTHVGAHVDHVAIGPHVPGHLGRQAYERRADLFHEFLHEHHLMSTNTFADREVNDDQTVFTRLDPAGRGASQIDFIAASRSLPAVSVGVDTDVLFKTDHRPILATFALRARAAVKRKGCPLNWRPNEAWVGAAVANTWNWADWKAGSEAWAQLAARHRERPARASDEALGALIAERRAAPAAQRREVDRRIYRHRRRLKRIRRADELLSAAARGAAPSPPKAANHVNWKRLFGNDDPNTRITELFTDIFRHSEAEHEQAECKRHMDNWQEAKDREVRHVIGVGKLRTLIGKLKSGKGSPDGLTAEMYKHLPDNALDSLSKYLTEMLVTLRMPAEWCAAKAVLLPKVIGAASLDKHRPIACLSTARKLIGHVWLSMLPELTFDSWQTGFVAGAHAAYGVHALQRALELGREWDKPVFIAQLDLRKAFDRVAHSAVLGAVEAQGASKQCVALLARMLSMARMAFSMGGLTSDQVPLQRGVPQGAPESPLAFILVVERVMRPLLTVWRAAGHGWLLDAFWMASVGFADDVVLVSHSKESLEEMVSQTIDGFAAAGLEVGTAQGKSHWTCFPPSPGCTLSVGGVDLPWESKLTYVGTQITPLNQSENAMVYRMAQATKTYGRWREVLTNRRHSGWPSRDALSGFPCFGCRVRGLLQKPWTGDSTVGLPE